jgi:hypothetical protein
MALWKNTYFVDLTTFIDIELSTFNFHVYIIGWQCVSNSKEAGVAVSTNLKFQEW